MSTSRIKAIKGWRNSDTVFFRPTPETKASGLAECYVIPAADKEAYWAMIILGRLALLGLPNRATRDQQVRAIAAAWGIMEPKKKATRKTHSRKSLTDNNEK